MVRWRLLFLFTAAALGDYAKSQRLSVLYSDKNRRSINLPAPGQPSCRPLAFMALVPPVSVFRGCGKSLARMLPQKRQNTRWVPARL